MVKVLGIDEAGRGPVIGPLMIAGALIEEGDEKLLGEVKDSKLLTQKKRVELWESITSIAKYKVIEVSPQEIDAAVESIGNDMNLNWLEAKHQAEIINSFNPDVVIIDCPHPIPQKYEDHIKKLVNKKDIKYIVEHKADFNYPICSAASILAKVRREEEMDKIKEKYGNTGPGYPANAVTQNFLKENWNKYPEIFRHSWSTYKKVAIANDSKQKKLY
ncbi:MAG: ribonuclease HII [Candidatus Pacearchaeota archaeon]|jgi:ribonuclease HII